MVTLDGYRPPEWQHPILEAQYHYPHSSPGLASGGDHGYRRAAHTHYLYACVDTGGSSPPGARRGQGWGRSDVKIRMRLRIKVKD